jgi:integrase
MTSSTTTLPRGTVLVIEECVNGWRNQYRSEQVARNYEGVIYRLARWLADEGSDLLTAHPSEIARYMLDRAKAPGRKGKTLSPSTMKGEWKAITLFYGWMAKALKDEYPHPDPLRSLTRPRVPGGKDQYVATLDEYERLCKACDAHPNAKLGRRNRAMVMLMWHAMRKGELAVLDIEHVDMTHDVVTIPMTKNGDSRQVPITPECHAILFRVIRDLHRETGPLFVGKKGRLTESGIEQALQWPRHHAGLDHMEIHGLRRGFVTWAMEERAFGEDTREVLMTVAGWKSAKSMEFYDKSDKQKRAIGIFHAKMGKRALRAVN